MGDPEPVLVSACLLGRACRYDGRHNCDRSLAAELERNHERAVPYCPEEAGGLGTPRAPAWIESRAAGEVLDGRDRVVTEAGQDVSAAFRRGAEGAREVCTREGIRRAYLKERSPSCGVRCTHVAGKVVDGPGVAAELLRREGVEVIGVEGRRQSPEGRRQSPEGRGPSPGDRRPSLGR